MSTMGAMSAVDTFNATKTGDVSPPSIHEQREIILPLLRDHPMNHIQGKYETHQVAIISIEWMRAYEQLLEINSASDFSHADASNPGFRVDHPHPGHSASTMPPLQNIDFLDGDKINTEKATNISISAYEQLRTWFGGDSPLIRPYIQESSQSDRYVVNYNPIEILVATKYPTERYPQNFQSFSVYSEWDMKCLYNYFIQKVKKNTHLHWRAWTMYARNANDLVYDHDTVSFCMSKKFFQGIIFDMSLDGETFSISNPSTFVAQSKSYVLPERDSVMNQGDNVPSQPGVCGLRNLGNTCYMNCALQCLSKTKVLQRYFIEKLYMKEINTDNPLGKKGKVAMAFANIMELMWSGQNSSIRPLAFKKAVEECNPQFYGYDQHDCCELLQCVMDGIHEDLNRIVNKPEIINVDDTNLPDEELADISWKLHKLRNDSIIVDKFTGQLRSVVRCPECHYESHSFSPFLHLSLPIPDPALSGFDLSIKLITLPGHTTWQDIRMTIPNGMTSSELKQRISEITKIKNILIMPAKRLNLRNNHLLMEDAHLSLDIHDDFPITPSSEILAYELDKNYGNILCYLMCRNSDELYQSGNPVEPLLPFPIPVPVHNGMSSSDIHEFILHQLLNFIPVEYRNKVRREITEKVESAPSSTSTISEPFLKLLTPDSVLEFNSEPIYPLPKVLYAEFDLQTPILGRTISEIARPSPFDDRNHTSYNVDGTTTLEKCLDAFLLKEKLNDTWSCKKCGKKVEAEKKLDIWKLPEVLIIQLNRFSYDSRGQSQKVRTPVNFPAQMNLSHIAPHGDHHEYQLFGTCNHSGSLHGGHYTSNCLVDTSWYHFNDSISHRISEREALDPGAYVLFYISKKATPATQGVRKDGRLHASELRLDRYIK